MTRPATLIVCKSVHHHNTWQLAECLAEVLAADVVEPEAVTSEQISRYDLIGFGSGVYYGRMHPTLLEVLRCLRRRKGDGHGSGVAAFVFSTSGLPVFSRLWHWPLKVRLAREAVPVIGEFACRGFDSWGPLFLIGGLNRHHPDARDLEQARRFARRLLATWESVSSAQAA
jgi:flavodoxin